MALPPEGMAPRAPALLDALFDLLAGAVRDAAENVAVDARAILGELPSADDVLRELAGDTRLPMADLTLIDERPERVELRGTATVLSQPGVALAFGFGLTADGVALTDITARVAEPGAMRLSLPGIERGYLAVHHLAYAGLEEGAGLPALDATLRLTSNADDGDGEHFAVRVSRPQGPAGEPWTLILADETRPAGIVDGLLTLLGSPDALGPLGAMLRAATDAVRLDELTLTIDPAAGRLQAAALALAATREGSVRWTVIDGALAIAVREVRARVEPADGAVERVITGSLAGTVRLGDANADIDLDMAEAGWTLALAADAVALASPGELLAMAGLSALSDALPGWMRDLGAGGSLHDFSIDLDPRSGRVRTLGGTVDFAGGALPGLTAARITALRATLEAADSADGGAGTITCDGTLALGDAIFEIAARVELGHGVSGGASLLATQQGPLSLAALLSVFGVADDLLGSIGTLRLEETTIAIGPAAGAVTLNAALSAPEGLAIPGIRGVAGGGTLHISRDAVAGATAHTATLALRLDAPPAGVHPADLLLTVGRGADEAAAHARITGTMRIADVDVMVAGTRPATADAGWRLAGHLTGTAPRLAELVGDVLPGSSSPIDLPSSAVRALEITYDTATGAFTLEAETDAAADLTRLAPADLQLPSAELRLSRIVLRAAAEQSLALEGTAAGAEAWVNVRREGSTAPWQTTIALHARKAPDIGPFSLIRDWIGPTTLVRLADEDDIAWWNAAPRPAAFASFTRDHPGSALLFDTTFYPRRTPLEALPLLGDLLPDEGVALRGGAALDLYTNVLHEPVRLEVLTLRRLGVGLRGTLASPRIVAEAECDVPVALPGVSRSTLRFVTAGTVAVADADVGVELELAGEVGEDGLLKTEMVTLDRKSPPARVAGFHPFGLRGITLGALTLHYGRQGRAFRGWALIADAQMDIEAVMEGPRSAFHFAAERLTLQNVLDGFLDEKAPSLPRWLGDTGFDAVRLDWASTDFTHDWPPDGGGAAVSRRYEQGLRGVVRLSVFGCRAAARFDVQARRFAGSMDRVDLGDGMLTIERSAALPEPPGAEPGAHPTHAESGYEVLPGPFIEADFGGAAPTFALSARVTLLRALTLDVAARMDASGFRFDFSQSVDYGVRFRVDLNATLPRPGVDAVARVGGRIGFGIEIAGFDLVAVAVGVEMALAGPRVSGVLRGEFTLLGQRMRFTVEATIEFRSLEDICTAVLAEGRRVGKLAVAFLKDVLAACVQLAEDAMRACVAAAEAVVELGRQILGFLEDLGKILRDVGEEIGSWFGSTAKRDRERAARERVRLAQEEQRLRERIRDEEEQEALYRLADAALLDAVHREKVESRIRAYPAVAQAGAINPIVETPDWRAAGRGYYAERWRLAQHEALLRQQARDAFHDNIDFAARAHAGLAERRAAAAARLAAAQRRVEEARRAMGSAAVSLRWAQDKFNQHNQRLMLAQAALHRAETAVAAADAVSEVVHIALDAARGELAAFRDGQLAAARGERDAAVAEAAPWMMEATNAEKRAIAATGELLQAETELRDCLEALRQLDRALEAADPGQWYAARNAAGARGLDEWAAARAWREAADGPGEAREAATAALLAGDPDTVRQHALRGAERLAGRARELSARVGELRAEEMRRAESASDADDPLARARATADEAASERDSAAAGRDAAQVALAEAERRLLDAERTRRGEHLAADEGEMEETLAALANRGTKIETDLLDLEAKLSRTSSETGDRAREVEHARDAHARARERMQLLEEARAPANQLLAVVEVYQVMLKLHEIQHHPRVIEVWQMGKSARATLVSALERARVEVEPWLRDEWLPGPYDSPSYAERIRSAMDVHLQVARKTLGTSEDTLRKARDAQHQNAVDLDDLESRRLHQQQALDANKGEYEAALARARERTDTGDADVLAAARATAEGRAHAEAAGRLRTAAGRVARAEEALVAARAEQARLEAGRRRENDALAPIEQEALWAARQEADVRATLARTLAHADALRAAVLAVSPGEQASRALEPAVEQWISVVTRHAASLDEARDNAAALHDRLAAAAADVRPRAAAAGGRREVADRRAAAAAEWTRVLAAGAGELRVLTTAVDEALGRIAEVVGRIDHRLPIVASDNPALHTELQSLRDRFVKIRAHWLAAMSRARTASGQLNRRPNLMDPHFPGGDAYAVRRNLARSLDEGVASTGARLDALRRADAKLAFIHDVNALRAYAADAQRLVDAIAAAGAVAGNLARAAEEAETAAAACDALAAEGQAAAARAVGPDIGGIEEVLARSYALVSAAARAAGDDRAMLTEVRLLRAELHEARLLCALLTDPEDGDLARLRARASELRAVSAAAAAAYAEIGELPARDDTPLPALPEMPDATTLAAAVARAVVARRDFAESVRREVLETRAALAVRHPAYGRALEELRRRVAEPRGERRLRVASGRPAAARAHGFAELLPPGTRPVPRASGAADGAPPACADDAVVLWSADRVERFRAGDHIPALDWAPTGMRVGADVIARIFQEPGFGGAAQYVRTDVPALADGPLGESPRSLQIETLAAVTLDTRWTVLLEAAGEPGIVGPDATPHAPLVVLGAPEPRSQLHILPIAASGPNSYTAAVQSAWNQRFLDLGSAVPRFVEVGLPGTPVDLGAVATDADGLRPEYQPTSAAPWNELLGVWIGSSLPSATSLLAELAPPTVIVECEPGGAFALRHAEGRYLCHEPATGRFGLTGERESRARLRIAARVADSVAELGPIPQGTRALVEPDGDTGAAYLIRDGDRTGGLDLRARPAATRRDDAEWNAALSAAQRRAHPPTFDAADGDASDEAGDDLARVERVAALWTILQSMLDDVGRGWEIEAARRGLPFPEAELAEELAPHAVADAADRSAGGRTGVVHVEPPRLDAHLTDGQGDFWAGRPLRAIDVKMRLRPSTGVERQVVLAREAGFSVSLDDAGDGTRRIVATVADEQGTEHTFTGDAVTLPAGVWSSLAIGWRAGTDTLPGQVSLEIDGTRVLVAPLDAAELSPGTGAITIGESPAPGATGPRVALRDVRIGDGSPVPIGDWPLDDGPGPWARDRSAAGQHGLVLHA